MTAGDAPRDFAPLLERLFFFDAVEASYEVSGITGRIPEWLRGTYYVNGPARFERPGATYKHWLDGDGMVCSLRFGAEGVHYTSKFVETPKLREEAAAGRFLFRGFGTAFPNDRLRRKVMLEPPVNVSVYPYNGKLLAFGEQTLPYELDPVTLETRGEYDFNGNLNEVSPFAAHAKYDGHLLNFGVSFSASKPTLNVYEFDGAGGLVRRKRHDIQWPHSLHDFAFTSKFAVFFLSPLLMNFQRFWEDGASVMESLDWEPDKGSRILVSSRSGAAAEAFTVPVGAGYCLHLINCFEEDGKLAVDVLEIDRPVYPDYEPMPDIFVDAPPCRPVRYVIDLASKSLLERIAMRYDRTPDFPSVDGAFTGSRYEDFWMLGMQHSSKPGRKFFDELVHGSWQRGEADDIYALPMGEYLGGEPVMIANPADRGEAVVIAQHLQPATDQASFLIFDAFRVRSGPIARLPLKHRLHPGFHSSFWRS